MAPSNDVVAAASESSIATLPNRIHEVFHPGRTLVTRTAPFVSAPVAVAAFAAGGVVVAAIGQAYDTGIGLGLVIYTFIGLPLLFACLVSRAAQLRQSQERAVTLADGVVRFATANDDEACSLSECCWFRGKATDDCGLSYQNIRQRAILLVFPSGRTIACGLTAPFDEQWIAALHAHHCRKVIRQEGAVGVLVGGLALAGLIGGAALGYHAGVALQDHLFRAPQNKWLANLLPVSLFILGGFCGSTWPFLIPGWLRHTKLERQQFVRFAIVFPFRIGVLAGGLFGGLFFALPFAAILLALAALFYRANNSPPRTPRIC